LRTLSISDFTTLSSAPSLDIVCTSLSSSPVSTQRPRASHARHARHW
jgi:hypothetical protein